jgi:predicted transcriptional regulator
MQNNLNISFRDSFFLHEQIYKLIQLNPGCTMKQLRGWTFKPRITILDHIKKLKEEGKVNQQQMIKRNKLGRPALKYYPINDPILRP